MEISVSTILALASALLTVAGLIWKSSADYAKFQASIALLEVRAKDIATVNERFQVDSKAESLRFLHEIERLKDMHQVLEKDAIRTGAVSARLTEILETLSTKMDHIEDKVGVCTTALMDHMTAEEKIRTSDTQRNSTFQFEVMAMLRKLEKA